ncbi:hypothetical protein MRF4_13550 [Methylobacterium radiotolerans]|uniref:TAXI family TRAP transporter solute-binding subunit n=1 Tax=Methylobacterium TaxID=407 RepID=UPI002F2CBA53
MKPWLRATVAVGVVLGVAAAGAYVLTAHPSLIGVRYKLTLATGPVGSEGQKVLAAFIRDLATEHPLVRLVPVPKDDLSGSAKALMSGEVDLAIVRSDDEAAAHGRTLFVLRQIGVAVLLPPEAKIEKVSELAGKKIVVANGFDPDLLKAFTEFYGLRKADFIEMPLTKFGSAMKSGSVVAAIVAGPLGPGPIPDAYAAIRKRFRADPSYLDIAEADAIVARWPSYESVEIKKGTFGGTPAEPAETINTFAVRILLVSRASLPDRVAGEITRMLLSTKAKLVTSLPAAAQMEAPDTEMSNLLPVHPGTVAYLDGEQESLLDQTLNFYWLGAMVFAVLAPLAGLIASRKRRLRSDGDRAELRQVVELLKLVRAGPAARSQVADAELESLREGFLDRMAAGEMEPERFQLIEGIIAQSRLADDRRRGSDKPDG